MSLKNSKKELIVLSKKGKSGGNFISLSKPYFETVCKKAKTYELFENLYVTDSNKHGHSKKAFRLSHYYSCKIVELWKSLNLGEQNSNCKP